MAESTHSTDMSRRQALGLIAAAPAAMAAFAMGKAIAAPDPVFAVIERHKAAEVAYSKTLNACDSVWARENGYKTTRADIKARADACNHCDDVMDELIATVPMTLAGLRAVLAYFNEYDDTSHLENVVAMVLRSPVFSA